MKHIRDIEALRAKYWAGETSLDEEKYLREHAQQAGDLERDYFEYLAEQSKLTYTKEVEMPQRKVETAKRWRVMGIAAAMALLSVAFWSYNQYEVPSSNEIIIDDPEVALQITKEALSVLSGQVAKGEEALLSNMAHLEKTFIFKY